MARLTFLEVQAYANNAGCKLEKRSQGGYSLNNEHYIFLYSEPNEYGNKAKIGEYRLTALADVLLTIKEGYLLQGECSLIKEETETHLETYVNEVKDKEVKEVVKEEYYSSVHRTFLKVGSKYSYVDPKNDIFQDVVFEDANGTAVLNFRAIDKNGNKVTCEGSLFVVTEYNRDCLKPFTSSVAIAKVTEVKNELTFDEIKSGELQDDTCDLPVIIEEQFFNKVKEYALSCGYNLTKLSNDECNFSLCSTSDRVGRFTKLTDVTEVINEGRLLSGEACAWPMPINSLNNSQGAIVANLKIKNKEEIDKSRKINLKINGKMVAVNPDDHNLKLTHDPVFGWQLVGADSQELIREPLNPQTKEQPSLKFKTKESATNFAAKLMAKIKKI